MPKKKAAPNNDQQQTETSSRDERITSLAHQMWEDEGRPEGKAEEHWARAAALVDEEADEETAMEEDVSAPDHAA